MKKQKIFFALLVFICSLTFRQVIVQEAIKASAREGDIDAQCMLGCASLIRTMVFL